MLKQKRCPNGSRKNKERVCTDKSLLQSSRKRCPNGSRKNKAGDCIKKSQVTKPGADAYSNKKVSEEEVPKEAIAKMDKLIEKTIHTVDDSLEDLQEKVQQQKETIKLIEESHMKEIVAEKAHDDLVLQELVADTSKKNAEKALDNAESDATPKSAEVAVAHAKLDEKILVQLEKTDELATNEAKQAQEKEVTVVKSIQAILPPTVDLDYKILFDKYVALGVSKENAQAIIDKKKKEARDAQSSEPKDTGKLIDKYLEMLKEYNAFSDKEYWDAFRAAAPGPEKDEALKTIEEVRKAHMAHWKKVMEARDDCLIPARLYGYYADNELEYRRSPHKALYNENIKKGIITCCSHGGYFVNTDFTPKYTFQTPIKVYLYRQSQPSSAMFNKPYYASMFEVYFELKQLAYHFKPSHMKYILNRNMAWAIEVNGKKSSTDFYFKTSHENVNTRVYERGSQIANKYFSFDNKEGKGVKVVCDHDFFSDKNLLLDIKAGHNSYWLKDVVDAAYKKGMEEVHIADMSCSVFVQVKKEIDGKPVDWKEIDGNSKHIQLWEQLQMGGRQFRATKRARRY